MAAPTRAIFWDNDGVLVETEHLYFQATQEVFASIGIDLTRDDYVALFLVKGRGAWHIAEQRGDVALLRQREYTIQLRTHCLALPGQCKRLRAERVAALYLQRVLVDLVERALVIARGDEAANQEAARAAQ